VDEDERGLDSVQDRNILERAKMVRTLKQLLKKAKKEAANPLTSPDLRLRWVNTMCYITQTWNSVLKDSDYEEMKREVERIDGMVSNYSKQRLGQSQTDTRKSITQA
jgi:hypothetical protein